MTRALKRLGRTLFRVRAEILVTVLIAVAAYYWKIETFAAALLAGTAPTLLAAKQRYDEILKEELVGSQDRAGGTDAVKPVARTLAMRKALAKTVLRTAAILAITVAAIVVMGYLFMFIRVRLG